MFILNANLPTVLKAAATALLVVAAVASCSSSPARPPEPGADPPVTAGTQGSIEPALDGYFSTSIVGEPIAGAGSTTAAAPPAAALGFAIPPASTPPAPAATASVPLVALPDVPDLAAIADSRIQAPNPATIRIPKIAVDAPIVPLSLREDGRIEVPEAPDDAGWWLGGPEPGEPGPAVILGHVDSREGPAVFFNLRYLQTGDEIHVDRVDGSTLTYVVESAARHPKDDFPTDEVYGPTEQPTLRLVTCGGDYDFDIRSYPDNVIVYAALV